MLTVTVMIQRIFVLALLACQLASCCKFPSACVGWCLPGYYEEATDPDTVALLKDANVTVEAWELNHGDLIFGGSVSLRPEDDIEYIGYMYTQKIDYDLTDESAAIRRLSEELDIEFESLFLHFTEDTTFTVENSNDGAWTSLYGYPYLVGWTQNEQHSVSWIGIRMFQLAYHRTHRTVFLI